MEITKEYEVIIDLESKHIIVKAENEEEAKEKAIKEFKNNHKSIDCDYWVGECDEVKE